MTRLLLALILLLPVALQAAGLGVYNPAQHAVNGFMPTQLPGLLLWLDAGRQCYTNGTSVASLADFSGNAFFATNDTGSKRPTITNARFNGRDGMQFDGVDDFLVVSNIAGLTNKTAIALFFVLSSPSNSIADVGELNTRFGIGDLGTNSKSIALADATGLLTGETISPIFSKGTPGRLGSTNYSYLQSQPFVEFVAFSTNGTELWKNAVSFSLTLSNAVTATEDSSPKATGYANDNNLILGAAYNNKPTFAAPLNGRIAECIVFDQKPSLDVQLQITRYLGTKYGIVVQ